MLSILGNSYMNATRQAGYVPSHTDVQQPDQQRQHGAPDPAGQHRITPAVLVDQPTQRSLRQEAAEHGVAHGQTGKQAKAAGRMPGGGNGQGRDETNGGPGPHQETPGVGNPDVR